MVSASNRSRPKPQAVRPLGPANIMDTGTLHDKIWYYGLQCTHDRIQLPIVAILTS
jgi:hypothetical protein